MSPQVPPSVARAEPPDGGSFVARNRVLDADDVTRVLRRMAHEIDERNQGRADVVLIGLVTGGVVLADRLAHSLEDIWGTRPPVGRLDVSFYRDDLTLRRVLPRAVTAIPVDLTDRVVVLIDDVLFTGRTVRAALDALNDHGRPRAVQLAVLVDRGHRELPIRPDFVGKNLPTRHDEDVVVHAQGVDLGELAPVPPPPARPAPGAGR